MDRRGKEIIIRWTKKGVGGKKRAEERKEAKI